MFDFSIVTQWVDTLLRSWMSPTAAVIVECVLVGVCLLLGYAVIALALIYIERKSAHSSSAASGRTAWDPME